MTNEEAIKGLESLSRNFSGYKPNEEMFDMAIAALKAEPCEDAVSRTWIREHLGMFLRGCRAERTYEEIAEDVEAYIDYAPPVTPKPKTGHWEWVQYDYNPKFGNWHCSECRCVVVECVDKNEKGGIPLYKFCPQCGAKMEGESE